jgi:hypothetical protein
LVIKTVTLKVYSKKKYLVIKSNDTSKVFTKIRQSKQKLLTKGKINQNGSIKKASSIDFESKFWSVIDVNNTNINISKSEVLYESNYFISSNGEEVGISHLFYVKLKQIRDTTILNRMAKDNNLEVLGNNHFMPLWFTIATSNYSTGNTLKMANLFYESGNFVASEPDILIDNLTICVNDTHFGNQWGLNNTGQFNGTNGIDINLCEARQISMGNNDVIVAVLDHGIELNHPDMTNLSLNSFDTETNTSPSQIRGDHGTACAGIIGANSNNSLGVTGIAPNCQLMSISNNLFLGPNAAQNLANGINYAWNNGASVISNSWGHNALTSTLIDDAITNAFTRGRNGLGCIVVFASGNNNSAVTYPANSNANILVVGAMSPCGQRKNFTSCDGETRWGSNFGNQLDIVAPGVLILYPSPKLNQYTIKNKL